MKTTSTFTKLIVASAVATLFSVSTAHADSTAGYAQTKESTEVEGAFGGCWKTQYFSDNMATEKCDPDLVKKPEPAPAPVAQKPEPTPEPTPAPAPRIVTTKVTLESDAYFGFDNATLNGAGKNALDEEIAKLRRVQVDSIVAIGHTDSVGPESYNQKLSMQRANSAKEYLVSKGIPASLIEVRGMGESQPVASNSTRAGRAQNRRVEVIVRATQRRVK